MIIENSKNPEGGVFASGGQIRTPLELWDAVIEYFYKEEFDTDAMRKVWRRCVPRITYQDIANVFSSVFADTYWNGISMDQERLAGALIKAFSVEKLQAMDYSRNALKNWKGIMVRFDDSDSGSMPRNGNYLNSIDIVCNNNSELDPSDLIGKWNERFYQTPQKGKNYIYARCQNIGFKGDLYSKTSGRPLIKMFYTDGGLNQPPSSWQKLFTAIESKEFGEIFISGDVPGPMPEGTPGASEGFIFDVQNSGHFCLIGVVSTDFFSNDFKAVSRGNWNSNQWIANNGASGWHNVNVSKSVKEKLVFYNQDGSTENFSFIVNCAKVPIGSSISIKSSDNEVQLNSGIISIHTESQSFEIVTKLPPYYKGELIVSMVGPDGNVLPSMSSVTIKMVWRLGIGHKHYSDALKVYGNEENYLRSADINIPLAAYTFIGGNP